ncbi:MAG: replicative DNA helicase, partial [Chloroflexi bacterium]|nr:replicative DNA helicase [Chloroflexota bacterium]
MASIERAVPQNIEAEQAVLGSILIDDNALFKVASFLGPEHFYVEKNGWVFAAFMRVSERREPIDVLTVCDDLERQGQLQEAGGAAYITSLLNAVPTAIHVEYYGRLVERTAVLRELIAAAGEIARLSYEATEDADDALDQSEQLIFNIAQGRVGGDFVPLSQILAAYLEQLDQVKEGATTLGLPTGFVDLDKLTGGLQPGDLIILAARPSVGKCLSFDSEIVLADGSIATIEELVRQRQATMFTLGQNWQFEFTSPSDFVDDGIKPVFAVTTRLGRTIETTASHPFLTLDGWKPLVELQVGARIAVPRALPVFGNASLRDCLVKLLAYLIGDGGLTGNTPRFTNTDPRIQQDFAQSIDEFGGLVIKRDNSADRAPSWRVSADPVAIATGRKDFASRLRAAVVADGRSQRKIASLIGVSPASLCHWTKGLCVPNPNAFVRLCQVLDVQPPSLAPSGYARISGNSKNALCIWLDELGLMGKNAYQKTIPVMVFQLTRQLLALFLNRLFATDGWLAISDDYVVQLGYASASSVLVRQIQHLLLRFGIISRTRSRPVKYDGATRRYWQLDITDAPSIKAFVSEIGILGKEDLVSRALAILDSRGRKPNLDTVPALVWEHIAEAKGDESWSSLAQRAGIKGYSNIHVGKRGVSRHRLTAMAAAVGSEPLQDIAHSAVYWDEIVSIEPAGLKQVYDLTIPGTHNFVANDICVHNTALALNIAHHIAVKEDAPVAVFSLEMSREQLAHRLLCVEARIDSQRLRLGQYDEDELRRVSKAFAVLSEAPIYVDDTAGISVIELRSKARRLHLERGIRLVVVDYLQLMRGRRAENRVQEISDISRSLKGLAKELGVP